MANVFRVSLLQAACHVLSAQELKLNENGCGQTSGQFIVNGTLAKENQFPWTVFLKVHFPTFYSRCGGSIITRRHILTAGHCTIWDGKEVVKIDVIYGNTDIHRGTKLKVGRHSGYRAISWFNDVAILLVDKPLHYANNARTLRVPLAPTDFFKKEAVVAGWGRLRDYGPATDRIVYTVVRILPNDICAKAYKYLNYRKDTNYCACQNETAACQGDSGGPLFVKAEVGRFIQAGVVSYGMGCGGAPGVYTRVHAYADWIQKSIRSHEEYRDLVVEDVAQRLVYRVFQWNVLPQALSNYVPTWPSYPRIHERLDPYMVYF